MKKMQIMFRLCLFLCDEGRVTITCSLTLSLSHARARTHTHSHTESISVNRQTSVDMHIIIQTVEQTNNYASQTNRCRKR